MKKFNFVPVEEMHTMTRRCPRCNRQYVGFPALGRRDNKEICSACGEYEAYIDRLER
jgi:ribosomal protein S27AE